MNNNESSISEKKRQLKREFNQSVFIILVVICVMVFTTIAWYTQNNTVDTAGLSTWSNYQSRFELQVGTETTDLDNQTISCVLEDPLYDSAEDDGKDYIGPGAKGELKIHILPNFDDVDSVKIKLSMRALGVGDQEITDDIKKKLIQGHLLLFHEKDDAGFYKELIQLNEEQEVEFTVSLQQENGVAQKTEKVIYWIWPVEFDDYVSYGEGSLFKEKAEMQSMITHINTVEDGVPTKENFKYYFYNEHDSDLSKLKEYTVQPLKEMGNEKRKFRKYYNNADQYIGKTIESLAIDLTIWE